MSDDSNETIGSLPGNYRLHFNCTDPMGVCYYNKRMDLQALIKRLGGDFKCIELYDVLKCPECGGRNFLIMTTPVHFSYPDDGK